MYSIHATPRRYKYWILIKKYLKGLCSISDKNSKAIHSGLKKFPLPFYSEFSRLLTPRKFREGPHLIPHRRHNEVPHLKLHRE